MQSQNVPDPCAVLCLEELEKQARRLGNSTRTTVAAGNSVVIFTMLLLEEVLEQLALNPITNLVSIIAVSNSIASLNNSVKIDP